MKIILLGPNLPAKLARTGTLHAHAEGCADIKRNYSRATIDADSFPFEAASIKDIITDAYPPGDFGYDPNNPDEYVGYRSDVHVFPCVTLPEEASI